MQLVYQNHCQYILNTFNSNTVPEDKIIDSILNSMDLSPSGIIKHLNLQKPIYSKTAAYGHFGQVMVKMVVFLGKR